MFKNIVLVSLGCFGGALVTLGVLTVLYAQTQTSVLPSSEDGTVLLDYSIPSSDEIAVVNEVNIPSGPLFTEGLETVLALEGVSEGYIRTLNDTATKVAAVEEQFKLHVLVEVASLQKSAASGNYLDLFRYMSQAKSEVVIVEALLLDLEKAVDVFQSEFLETALVPDVQDATVMYIEHLRTHIKVGQEAADALNSTLNGKIPTRAQISEVERLQIAYNEGIVVFTELFEKLRVVIEVSA